MSYTNVVKDRAILLYDGFKNILKNIGTAKDPREFTTFTMGIQITLDIANNLYIYNWLAAKVVDVPIDDATRKWISVLIPDVDKKKEIEDAILKFEVKESVNLAAKWARVFGGSVILAIIENEDLEEPLVVENIKSGSFKNFIVLDRYNIYPEEINRNILSTNYGKPEFYMVSREGQRIHHTRLTKFFGLTPTLQELERQNYWGTSIFTKMWEPISDSQIISQSIATLIFEASVDIYKVKGFHKMVAEGKDELVVKRLKLASEMKGILNAIALDGEDEYAQKTNTFANLPEIDDRGIQKVSGASNIPVTKLIGISPSGMNATGESDMLNYYDDVQATQENELRPHIDWMLAIVEVSEFGKAKEPIKYIFNPLKQLTEIEQSEVDSKNATRDQTYLDEQIIKNTDVLAQLAENGTYVTIDENRVAEEKKLEELETEFEEEEENLEDPEEDPEENLEDPEED